MGNIKVVARLLLQLLVLMFAMGMVNTSRLVDSCGHAGRDERVVMARYLLVRAAPLAAGILFWVAKVTTDSGPGWKLRALFLLGVGLSGASSILAVVAQAFEFYCVANWWPAVVLATVPVGALYLFFAWLGVSTGIFSSVHRAK